MIRGSPKTEVQRLLKLSLLFLVPVHGDERFQKMLRLEILVRLGESPTTVMQDYKLAHKMGRGKAWTYPIQIERKIMRSDADKCKQNFGSRFKCQNSKHTYSD
ncbi:hypothetical protein VNO77_09439 [Canavalia gladiata]|uniref:Uncharacterized protein n=1 Tax=Canavalia gladiata TaxID=3824 RepID=A0AAN9M975_CANGL